MLVGIDDDGVCLADGGIGAAGGLGQVLWNEAEVAAVRRVDVDAEAIAVAEGEDLVERIDGADGGCAQSDDDRAHISTAKFSFQGFKANAATMVGRNLGVIELKDGRDAAMGVVGLLGTEDALARRKLTGYPKRLKVGEGTAGGEMAEKLCPGKHLRDLADGLNLHFGTGASAIAGVVIRIHGHGQGVSGARHRVGRLEHLAGIEGMEIRVVVAEALGHLMQNSGDAGGVSGNVSRRQGSELLLKLLGSDGQQGWDLINRHGDLPQ